MNILPTQHNQLHYGLARDIVNYVGHLIPYGWCTQWVVAAAMVVAWHEPALEIWEIRLLHAQLLNVTCQCFSDNHTAYTAGVVQVQVFAADLIRSTEMQIWWHTYTSSRHLSPRSYWSCCHTLAILLYIIANTSMPRWLNMLKGCLNLE